MARRPITPRVREAARRNIKKAQVSRIRIRESRSIGRTYKLGPRKLKTRR